MDKLELMALADDSMHGKANVINHLQVKFLKFINNMNYDVKSVKVLRK